MESSTRSIVKTVSWRLTGTISTFAISWILSGDIVVSGAVAGIQFPLLSLLYYVHERIWNKIKWGSLNER